MQVHVVIEQDGEYSEAVWRALTAFVDEEAAQLEVSRLTALAELQHQRISRFGRRGGRSDKRYHYETVELRTGDAPSCTHCVLHCPTPR
jgi:hypothetical protein